MTNIHKHTWFLRKISWCPGGSIWNASTGRRNLENKPYFGRFFSSLVVSREKKDKIEIIIQYTFAGSHVFETKHCFKFANISPPIFFPTPNDFLPSLVPSILQTLCCITSHNISSHHVFSNSLKHGALKTKKDTFARKEGKRQKGVNCACLIIGISISASSTTPPIGYVWMWFHDLPIITHLWHC